MPEKSLQEVPTRVRELFEKGATALQRGNLDYAISIFNQVLAQEPGLFECREFLRATQHKKAGNGGSFLKKMFSSASSSPLLAKGQMALRKAPLDAIQIAEQILNNDPGNAAAHKLLAEAAMESDLPQTAILSLEILVKNHPKDKALRVLLADTLAEAGEVARAEKIYTELLRANPNDPTLAKGLKNLSAQKSLKESGFEAVAANQGTYRDLLKDEGEAAILEHEQRSVKTEDVTARLIAEYEERLKADPGNLRLVRTLAELFTEKRDFDRAQACYEQIRASDSGNDSSLLRAIADTKVKQFNHALEQLDPAAPDFEEKARAIQEQRLAYQIDECKKRSDRFPTDLQIRFELGRLYFQAGRLTEAIQEFQKAQGNPHRRSQAMSYLGQCFSRRGMYDLAARTLQNAIREKVVFDDEKKDLLYSLGGVYEKMGKPEDALDQFKQIYEVDISYKDVSAKVDAYYSEQNPGG